MNAEAKKKGDRLKAFWKRYCIGLVCADCDHGGRTTTRTTAAIHCKHPEHPANVDRRNANERAADAV